ncbi:hypothetical protein BBBOND_0201330 [Babesia bigemina]|uniref:Uncharacterized protein n=1 Tax=Babesia bigemina TaxID=5866 RepID=A0A061D2H6_BABBI|nr:hypothetical protein BBBOND_0201330 [Babesia bigemina]CDR94976.1 hypothetical protein BBBOND_0201330 [Babesia bigemina]|eukprot:XP_012767162.1 hypothetical protein BBBOND_0201330 [Babesia bigemina]
MVYTSLTEVPHNLKEGIDWLLALKGTDGENNLKAMAGAVHHLFSKHSARYQQLPAFEKIKSVAKEFLQKPELKDDLLVKKLLSRFYTPDSRENTGFRRYWHYHYDQDGRVVGAKGATPEFIEQTLSKFIDGCAKILDDIKNPDEYKSAYSSEATWEASCAKDPETCAVVLVGIAPILYAGLQSLRTTAEFKVGPFHTHTTHRNLGDMLKALGYVDPECRNGMNGAYIHDTFRVLDNDVIHKMYDLAGFNIFYGSDIVESLPVEQPVEAAQPVVEEALVAEKSVEPVKAAKSRKPGILRKLRKAVK